MTKRTPNVPQFTPLEVCGLLAVCAALWLARIVYRQRRTIADLIDAEIRRGDAATRA